MIMAPPELLGRGPPRPPLSYLRPHLSGGPGRHRTLNPALQRTGAALPVPRRMLVAGVAPASERTVRTRRAHGMAEANRSGVIQPADDVYCWLEQDSSVMLKAVTRFGDPVELTAEEARAIAAALLGLAE